MSIGLPEGLPARHTLAAEGVEVLTPRELRRCGRRPLRLCLVNLMPGKVATETQLARLLGATAIPVELILCVPDTYRSKTTPADHLTAFYRRWSGLRDEPFDGLVVTGAPVETLPFHEVDYWSELCAIFDWAQTRAIAGFYICWAAQAALHHFHGVPKHRLPGKMFGVFPHRAACRPAPLLRGLGEEFPVPVSRHTEVRTADLPAKAGLTVLADSADAGLCLIEDHARRAVLMFNHLEYDTGTLAEEFHRDRRAGKSIAVPRGYFPDDDPARPPVNSWRPYGHLLYANWLGEIDRAARPHASVDPAVQWALAPSAPAAAHGRDHSDLLIAAADGLDVLPAALRILADAGTTPRAVRVHRRRGEQLIEVRTDQLAQGTLERTARRLCTLSAVLQVAYRTVGGTGGWLLGHSARPESPAPRSEAA